MTQGCADNTVRQYDTRAGKTAVRSVNLKGSGSITCIATNGDGSFIMVGGESYNVSALHWPTSSVVASASSPFLPRAVCFSSGAFYCGGSDKIAEKNSRYLSVLDLQCRPAGTGSTPVSSRSIYAIAVHPVTGLMAAGGYFPGKSRMENAGEVIDIFCDPPVRSFSFAVRS